MVGPVRRQFVCDAHMGGLARYLRMLGIDALYQADGPSDDELAEIATATGRVLLSKDRQLLARLPSRLAYGVRATRPRAQLAEVFARFDLVAEAAPLTRCIVCNTVIEPLAAAAAASRVPADVARHAEVFMCCPNCRRVYWQGSHYRRMRSFADRVLGLAHSDPS